MSAEPILLCPRDGAQLDMGAFHDVPMCLCPTCQGSLVHQRRMNALLDVMSKELQRTIPLDAPLDRVPDKGPNVPCPACSTQMENYGYMGVHFVMVDSCNACRLLWLDTFELGAMSVQFARTTRRVDVLRTQEKSARLERARAAEIADVANAVGRAMMTGFVVGRLL